jgi:hypothetical protein
MVLNPVVAWIGNRQMDFMPLSGGGSIVVDTAITSIVLIVVGGAVHHRRGASGTPCRAPLSHRRISPGGTPALASSQESLGSGTAAGNRRRLRFHPVHLWAVSCPWFFRTSFRRVRAVQGHLHSPGGVCRHALGDPPAVSRLMVQTPQGRRLDPPQCQYVQPLPRRGGAEF